MKKMLKPLGNLIIALIIIACIPLAVPKLLGFSEFNVISGSMEPAISVGSLVYVKPADFNELSEKEQDELRDWMYDLLYQLYENEENYTKTLYDQVGWTEEVLTFLRYNANKALMNLGQDPLFPDTANDVNPIVMNGISTGTSNHDFFSQVGNGYLLGSVEAMQDDDYNYGLD